MKALGGSKKPAKEEAKPVAPAPAAKPAPAAIKAAPAAPSPKTEKVVDHVELNRDYIKAKEQKEKEVVKEEDMAYSIDAINDYTTNLNSIHDKYQSKFTTEGKKEKSFGLNDIEVSSLDDEDIPSLAEKQPEVKTVDVKKTVPAAAPKPAAPPKSEIVGKQAAMKVTEQPVEAKRSVGARAVESLVEPATTTVEAGGLKIEVSHLEELD